MKYLVFFLLLVFSVSAQAKIYWADSVVAVSANSAFNQSGPNQVLGEPSVSSDFGYSDCAWTVPPKTLNKSMQWITVAFEKPITTKAIFIHENFYPGSIFRIELLNEAMDRADIVYQNGNPRPLAEKGQVFKHSIKSSNFPVKYLKLHLNNYKFSNYQRAQIDAIGISDEDVDYYVDINLPKDLNFPEYPENLGKNINSKYSEVTVVISPDGNTLYFSRKGHPDNMEKDKSSKSQDIWYSELDSNGNFLPAENIGEPINNLAPNSPITAGTDGKSLILMNRYNRDGSQSMGFSVSYLDGDKWSFPEPLEIDNYYNKYEYASFSMGADGKTLILSIQRDDSRGKTDLYVSFLQDNGIWSEPKNLGNVLNTAAPEDTPFLASDNETLYFASAGHPGYGMNDIFMTRRLDDSWENWSKPVNLGSVINTSGWDSFFTIPASGEYAYFVSSYQSYGRDDIFKIKLPDALKPKTVTLIAGKVLDAKSGKPLSARIIYQELPSGNELGQARSNKTSGEYKIVLPRGKKYAFLAEADGYIAINQFIDLRDADKYAEISRNLELVPIEKGQTIRMNNIFFETAKFELLEDSYAELDRVVDLLNKNPKLNILIEGHTDSIGKDEANLLLSEQRANAVLDYILSKGIEKSRLKTKGFGEKKPISNNNTEEGRQQNRRVQFKILEM